MHLIRGQMALDKVDLLYNTFSLQNDVHTAFYNKQHHVAILFDIEKAYDTTWRFKIIQRSKEMGITGNMLHFIKNFLSNRKFYIRCNEVLSEEKTQQNGVP